jgi:hypothetical protein
VHLNAELTQIVTCRGSSPVAAARRCFSAIVIA